jgi:hypothetical protein
VQTVCVAAEETKYKESQHGGLRTGTSDGAETKA